MMTNLRVVFEAWSRQRRNTASRMRREYFEEHLCVGDYYDEGQRVSGEWFGLGAERLGLSGKVRAEEFLRLCENQHPVHGRKADATAEDHADRTAKTPRPIGGYSTTSPSLRRSRFPWRASWAMTSGFLKLTRGPCVQRCTNSRRLPRRVSER